MRYLLSLQNPAPAAVLIIVMRDLVAQTSSGVKQSPFRVPRLNGASLFRPAQPIVPV